MESFPYCQYQSHFIAASSCLSAEIKWCFVYKLKDKKSTSTQAYFQIVNVLHLESKTDWLGCFSDRYLYAQKQ